MRIQGRVQGQHKHNFMVLYWFTCVVVISERRGMEGYLPCAAVILNRMEKTTEEVKFCEAQLRQRERKKVKGRQ